MVGSRNNTNHDVNTDNVSLPRALLQYLFKVAQKIIYISSK